MEKGPGLNPSSVFSQLCDLEQATLLFQIQCLHLFGIDGEINGSSVISDTWGVGGGGGEAMDKKTHKKLPESKGYNRGDRRIRQAKDTLLWMKVEKR